MFTGDNSIADIVQDINCVENGILLEMSAQHAFGNLGWGIAMRMENGVCIYAIKTFRKKIRFYWMTVGDGTELYFSSASGHASPSPALCAHNLAVCYVVHACGAAVFNSLFQRDPDIIGSMAGSYVLPIFPADDDFVIPYFQRRLFEEQSRFCIIAS